MTPQFTTDTTCETHVRIHLRKKNTQGLMLKTQLPQNIQVGHKKPGAQPKGAGGLGKAGCLDPGWRRTLSHGLCLSSIESVFFKGFCFDLKKSTHLKNYPCYCLFPWSLISCSYYILNTDMANSELHKEVLVGFLSGVPAN